MDYRPSWDLSTIPDEALKSEWARRTNALRVTHSGGHNGGRPPEMVKCPRCGARVTKTQAARGHGCNG